MCVEPEKGLTLTLKQRAVVSDMRIISVRYEIITNIVEYLLFVTKLLSRTAADWINVTNISHFHRRFHLNRINSTMILPSVQTQSNLANSKSEDVLVNECSIEQDLDYPEIEIECGWRIENEPSTTIDSFFSSRAPEICYKWVIEFS